MARLAISKFRGAASGVVSQSRVQVDVIEMARDWNMRASDERPHGSPSRPHLASGPRRLAVALIVFGASGLIAAEVVTPLLRGAESATPAAPRIVISFDQPGYVTKLPKGAAPVAVPTVSNASSTYGCRSVVAIGDVRIGRTCNTRILSVAATE